MHLDNLIYKHVAKFLQTRCNGYITTKVAFWYYSSSTEVDHYLP